LSALTPTNLGELDRSGALDLPLRLDETPGPQSARVHQGLRDAILAGRLAPGSRLPASRALAAQLGMRRNTVVGAYEQLLSDGLVEARVGAGTYVADHVPTGPAGPKRARATDMAPSREVFALGRTGVDALFLNRLRRAVSKRLLTLDPVHLGYGDPRGGRELRERMTEHLAVSRGVRCDPGHIMLVGGTQHGLQLCLGAVLRPGDSAWMEDPGYPAARRVLEAAGARLVPVPVDGHGLVVDEGRRRAAGARVAYVTPSHQFPTGVVMRMDRRIALLDWARDADAWVLEDDYDSEFRYGGPPLTALAGIDAARRVIYFGTFSKVLFPGLRMGYVVLPPPLLEPILAARAASDRFPPSLLEGALADLIAEGDFSAHIRRMRGRYRAARDAVADTLAGHACGALQVTVPDQGLHLVAYLQANMPPGAAARIRAAAGVEAWLLSETRLVPGPTDGFVLGFSGHEIAALRDGAERLARAAKEFVADLRNVRGEGTGLLGKGSQD
jgi:GntR family transcriptional regulator/MocR family aminotransferase